MGIVWAATEILGASPIQSRLCAAQTGRVQCFGNFQQDIGWVYPDSKGNLWTGGPDGLWRWKPGEPKRYDTFPTSRAIEDERGTLVLAGSQELKEVVDGRLEKYTLPGIDWPFAPDRLFRSSDGSLWIGTENRGLIHVHRGRADWFAQADGLSGNYILSLFEDREGNVWVGTDGGLDRFRDVAVPTISSRQGLPDDGVWSVLAARDGSVWLGSPSGVSRWKDGEVTIYRRPHPKESAPGAPQSQPRAANAGREIDKSGLPGSAESLFEDDAGRIWVTTSGDVVRWDGSRFALVNGIPGPEVYAMAEDREGNVWIVSEEHGLLRVPHQGDVEQIPWQRLGHRDYALSIAIDPSRGGTWIGFARGGIAYWKDGQVRMSYWERDGLGKGETRALRFGSRGALWAATRSGLSRIKDGHVATLTSRDGLPCDTVHWSMEDDEHAVWLYMPCGLVRIERSDLDAWLANPSHTVHPRVFDISDGIRPRASLGGYGPLLSKSPDGKIWFTAYDGVSVIDPHHLSINKLPPPVHIEQIVADGKTYGPSEGENLPALVRDLTIDYTALSLVAPEKVHFRYKLEGQDPNLERGGQRPPGAVFEPATETLPLPRDCLE